MAQCTKCSLRQDLRVLHRNLLQPVNELPLEQTLPAQCQKGKTKSKKQKQTVCVVFMTNTHEDNTDSSDEEYTYQQIPCYRLVRSQQTEHHPQTEQWLRAKACEFHPAVREEADTQDQGENVPQAQDRALEDVALEEEHQVEEEPQDRLREDMVAAVDEHQAEAEAVRRSQRTARPRQPSYQQWDTGVNSLMPSYSLPSHLSAVPLPYFTPPHPYYYNGFTKAY